MSGQLPLSAFDVIMTNGAEGIIKKKPVPRG
jgi:hypothetical protein